MAKFKEYSIRIKEIETGTKYIVSGLKRTERERKRIIWVPLKKKDEKPKWMGGRTESAEERGIEILIFFYLLVYFSDLRNSDRRISSG